MIDHYDWPGGREAMLRCGPDAAPTVLVLPPLFEEANRMRRALVEVMRALDKRGIGSVLPDLPGTGDSMVATVDARFEHWAAAVAALPAMTATVAVRGGALLDGFARTAGRWRLAPESGARVIRDMIRATALSSDVTAAVLEARARDEPTRLAGNILHPSLVAALQTAVPGEDGTIRTVTLGEGPDSLPGAPLWRRAEPGDDAELVVAMADDIATWVDQCGLR